MAARAFYDQSDELITNWLDHNETFERYIFTNVAGVTFSNRDGSSRQVALCRCKPLDRIVLNWERDNPASRTAVAVYLENGSQLGYLESRLGKETCKRLSKGECWIGFLVRAGVATAHGQEVLGATIVIVKLKN
jgi:hypothetical protein